MGILGPTNMTSVQAGGMGIQIDMDPSPVILIAQFDKLGLDIRSFREPLKRAIQQVVAPSLRKNFEQGGRPNWPKLTEKTLQQKQREGFNSNATRPLVRSGKLKRLAGQLNIWNIEGEEGIASLSVPESGWYGRVHQEGSGSAFDALSGDAFASQRGYVPQRVWAVIQDEDVPEIEKVFSEWLDERVSRAGL